MPKANHTWSCPCRGVAHYIATGYWGTVTDRKRFVEASISPLDAGNVYCGFEHCEEKTFPAGGPAGGVEAAKAWIERWGDSPENREKITQAVRERWRRLHGR